jgi:hypothetical protein
MYEETMNRPVTTLIIVKSPFLKDARERSTVTFFVFEGGIPHAILRGRALRPID